MRPVSTIPSPFLLSPSLGAGHTNGVDGLEAGGTQTRDNGKEVGGSGGRPHMSWGCCIASWCAEGYQDV